MELSEHAIEQVSQGLGMPVSRLTSAPVVRVGSGCVTEVHESPATSNRPRHTFTAGRTRTRHVPRSTRLSKYLQ